MLFPLGLAAYGTRLRIAAKRLGLPGIVPHLLRHSGASMDALHDVLRGVIQERGNGLWRTR
jgi:integrase